MRFREAVDDNRSETSTGSSISVGSGKADIRRSENGDTRGSLGTVVELYRYDPRKVFSLPAWAALTGGILISGRCMPF